MKHKRTASTHENMVLVDAVRGLLVVLEDNLNIISMRNTCEPSHHLCSFENELWRERESEQSVSD